MPTNVTPEYKKAEAAFRKARDPQERLEHLNEMLKLIPKHKGTEHLQADIKSRIKELKDELAGPRKGGARTGPAHHVRPEGAAQVSLIGPPNAGKSSLHKRLTGSQAEIGPYPYTTQAPLPGMFVHEDVQFQLIDLPPVSADDMPAWMPNAVQPASVALLVVDIGMPGVVEHVVAIRERLDAKRVSLTDDWGGRLAPGLAAVDALADAVAEPASGAREAVDPDDDGEPTALDDPFRVFLPTILVVGKSDQGVDPDEVDVLLELAGAAYPAVRVSAETGAGLTDLGRLLMRGLDIVRVYTKIPGRAADMERPYTLARGGTVLDVARLIHRDIAASLKHAKVWGSAKFDGQQVGRDYVVDDGDVLELHS